MPEKSGNRKMFQQVPTATLRDYMAALAMQAMLQSSNESVPDAMADIAALAYQQADAMLEAR